MARPGDRPSHFFDLFIRGLIGANVLAVVGETDPEVQATAGAWLHGFEVVSVGVFSIEYVVRVWSSVESPGQSGGLVGRVRFALTGETSQL